MLLAFTLGCTTRTLGAVATSINGAKNLRFSTVMPPNAVSTLPNALVLGLQVELTF